MRVAIVSRGEAGIPRRLAVVTRVVLSARHHGDWEIPGWAARLDHRFLLFFENRVVLQHGCPSMKFELVKRAREHDGVAC